VALSRRQVLDEVKQEMVIRHCTSRTSSPSWKRHAEVQSDPFDPTPGYPFTGVLVGNTPMAFRDALMRARDALDRRPPSQRVLTVNAWNEWTEGSYLEPDTINGMAYLEAIRGVFGRDITVPVRASASHETR
jgi:hypothetical protein